MRLLPWSSATWTMSVLVMAANVTGALLAKTVTPIVNTSRIASGPVGALDIAAATITPGPMVNASTFGWETDGVPIPLPTDSDNRIICSTDREYSTARGPCFAWCLASDCMASASSVAATCSPQWKSYIDASQAWLQEHQATSIINYITLTNTSLEVIYSSTSTDSTDVWTTRIGTFGVPLTVSSYHPVYVFGKPESTRTHYTTTVSDAVQSHWMHTENGITTTATESPFPTSPPFCSVTEVATNFLGRSNCTEYINHCKINGGTVQLFYWPHQATLPANVSTSAFNGNFSASNSSPVLATVSGITMTSPSVYISLANIFATNYCGQTIGSDYSGRVITMNPGDVSSVAPQGPLNIYDPPVFSFNYANLQGIVPAQAWADANMCWDTACYTITNDEYRPYLSIPPEIFELDPSWSTCNPSFEGLYDPPQALTQAQVLAQPTLAHPHIAIALATPASTPTIATAQPTPTEKSHSGESWQADPSNEVSSILDTQHSTSTGVVESTPAGYFNIPSSVAKPLFSFDPEHAPALSASTPSSSQEIHHDRIQNPGTTDNGDIPPSAYATSIISIAMGDIIAAGIGLIHESASQGRVLSSHSQQGSSPPQSYDVSPPQAITIVSDTYTQLSGHRGDADAYIIAGQTLRPNNAITASGTTISLGASGSIAVVNGETQVLKVAEPINSVLLVGDETFTRAASALVVASQTIKPGEVATVSGSTIFFDPSNDLFILNGQTRTFGAPVALTTGNSRGSAGVVIAGETIRLGETATVSGTTIAVDSGNNFVVIDGTTRERFQLPAFTYDPENHVLEIVTLGTDTYTRFGTATAGFTIEGQVLSPGQAISVDDKTISLAVSGGFVVIDGTTETLQMITSPVVNAHGSSRIPTAVATTTYQSPSASVTIERVASPTTSTTTSGTAETLRPLWWTYSMLLFLWTVHIGLR